MTTRLHAHSPWKGILVQSVVKRSSRAILLDEEGRMLLIKRTTPDQDPYWTTPGGGVAADDTSVGAALVRELREELGAEVDAPPIQVFLVSSPVGDEGVGVQYFFVCRLRRLDLGQRSGPEFDDRSRGSYTLDRVDLLDGSLRNVDLKPTALKEFILANGRALADAAGIPTAKT
jgi:ADP-ribose pyrophosphatase YjhB (NUDIX family)